MGKPVLLQLNFKFLEKIKVIQGYSSNWIKCKEKKAFFWRWGFTMLKKKKGISMFKGPGLHPWITEQPGQN